VVLSPMKGGAATSPLAHVRHHRRPPPRRPAAARPAVCY
jgi:hypothetical protein